MVFDTWVSLMEPEIANEDQALIVLRRRFAELVGVVQGWGTCSIQDVTGDPLLGVVGAIPGMSPKSGPAPQAACTLRSALGFLPMRPASPWKHGSLLLRTPDGKLMPYMPNSAEQASWIDIGVAPMGGGKSVMLNALNFAFCFQAGLTRLPWISIIDVGPSSSGLIALLKAALPPDRQHLATYHRLRMTENYAVNPFDTPLGCRKPLPSHQAFLVNLMCLLATELSEAAPPSGIDGIARKVMEDVYEEFSDIHPKLYNKNLNPELHEIIEKLKINVDDYTTWWNIVDAFFELGYLHEAMLAQRYAVPLLSDAASIVRQKEDLRKIYNYNIGATNEHVLDYFWRTMTDAIAAYPILRQPTQFSIGDAQIISLDLDEVAPRGGAQADRQSAFMYMMARFIVASRFFQMPADVILIPDKYKKYHEKRINEIRQDPKRLCYDEVHRVTSQKAVADQIFGDMETSARESRKWNLSIGLYSQTYEDFPKVILELATSIFILGSGTEAGRQGLVQTFGLNSAIEHALTRLGKPDKAGANLIALFKTGSGSTQQILTNTIGPVALWAFSSTTEDVTVRNRLYDQYGVNIALRVLARLYPGGIKVESERRKFLRKETALEDEKTDILQELTNEISNFVKNNWDSFRD
jgi:intracellular multiplication protein IcmB